MFKTFSDRVEWFPSSIFGEVDQPITLSRAGRVHVLGSFWKAQFYHFDCQLIAAPGTSVLVLGRKGITLLVEPIDFDFLNSGSQIQ